MIVLTNEQQRILGALLDWSGSTTPQPYLTLGGYAGTGKTTLLSYFRRQLHSEDKSKAVAFCAFTGKAANVLKTKLYETKTKYKKDFVGTIHSLIYEAILDTKHGGVIGWQKKTPDQLEYSLIIVDEASMVSKALWDDLRSFHIPILAVGDHGQLPPIQDNFNLMAQPQLRLETIHRQAADNPIIQLSIQARERGGIAPGDYGPGVKKCSRRDEDAANTVSELLQSFNDETLVLVGYNKTRIRLNQQIRGYLDIYDPAPQPGDRVICLKNNRRLNIYNGMQGSIHTVYDLDAETDPSWYYADIAMDGGFSYFSGPIAKEQFNHEQGLVRPPPISTAEAGNFFDFGYAVTVHKAQGAQSRRVVLFEERFAKMDDEQWRRWLYTAVTRAEEELFIVG